MNLEALNTLLISPGDLKSDSLINSNVDDSTLSNIIITSQEIYLCKIIGTALMNRLQELVYNKVKEIPDADNISSEGFETYSKLLYNYVKPYLKYKSLEDFIVAGSFKFRNIGVVRNNDTGTNIVDLDSIRFLKHHYQTYVAEYEQRLSKFVCAHRNDLQELDAETLPYLDAPQIGETFSNTGGLWLGNHSSKGCKSCR